MNKLTQKTTDIPVAFSCSSGFIFACRFVIGQMPTQEARRSALPKASISLPISTNNMAAPMRSMPSKVCNNTSQLRSLSNPAGRIVRCAVRFLRYVLQMSNRTLKSNHLSEPVKMPSWRKSGSHCASIYWSRSSNSSQRFRSACSRQYGYCSSICLKNVISWHCCEAIHLLVNTNMITNQLCFDRKVNGTAVTIIHQMKSQFLQCPSPVSQQKIGSSGKYALAGWTNHCLGYNCIPFHWNSHLFSWIITINL